MGLENHTSIKKQSTHTSQQAYSKKRDIKEEVHN
ncbi:uncharacterized protein G2W53_039827 [Senna tora]|uniref:Uncharacterized protein n=1 Tax=Senna tora TaxID=362788 RepID=A0A834W6H3_9FABA|nr:uncharacterized protein G2W53_039827 [Senna tora]